MKSFLARLCLGTFQALTLLLVITSVIAQTVTTSISLGWTAPTQNTDGSSISGALAYQVYQGPKAGPFVAVGSPVSTTTEIITSASAGNCFTVSTSETIGASTTVSALSPTVCAEIPSGASGLTISFTVTVK